MQSAISCFGNAVDVLYYYILNKMLSVAQGDVESICNYSFHDEKNPVISMYNKSHLEDGNLVYYTLPSDKMYSTFFQIINAAGTTSIPGPKFSEI